MYICSSRRFQYVVNVKNYYLELISFEILAHSRQEGLEIESLQDLVKVAVAKEEI